MKEEQVCPNVSVKEEQVENQKQNENVLLEDGFQLFVKDLDGRTLTVIIGANNTVSDLKIIIWNKRGYPIDRQRLISDGKQLEDSRTLDYYNIRTLYTIHLYLSLNGC